MERIKIKEIRSQAKVVGTLVTFGGAMLMTLYKGPAFNLFHSSNTIHQNSQTHSLDNHKNWITGTLFIFLGCVAWSCFYILQSITVGRYPAELSLSSLICLAGTFESAVVALISDRRPQAWAIGFNYSLYGPLYTGIVSSGIAYYIQALVMQSRGPVFVTSFNPLCMIIVAALGSLLLGEQLHFGSIIGGIIIAIGLYSVVWGKGKDHTDHTASSPTIKETETQQLPITSPAQK
ncbi:hypothetical protein PIB30_088981 [Stylosanthes scabra]|uniref:WAT1-related protein n=1 Tax=Stylosanthes scabra TaxID=79078 RepID=A0ABU6VU62_9FABA|nr:hypothetical protein [Stylosanthes scabra]